jgi:hypothetical protein
MKKLAELSTEISLVTDFYTQNPDAAPIVVRRVLHSKRSVTKAAETMRRAYSTGSVSDEDVEKMGVVIGWEWDYGISLWAEAEPVLRQLIAETGTSIEADCCGHNTAREANAQALLVKAQALHAQGLLTNEIVANFESLAGWSWNADDTNFASFISGFQHARTVSRQGSSA